MHPLLLLELIEYSLIRNSCMSILRKTQLRLECRDNVLFIVWFTELYRSCMQSEKDLCLDFVVLEPWIPFKYGLCMLGTTQGNRGLESYIIGYVLAKIFHVSWTSWAYLCIIVLVRTNFLSSLIFLIYSIPIVGFWVVDFPIDILCYVPLIYLLLVHIVFIDLLASVGWK